MFVSQRHQQIINLLEKERSVKASDLMQEFSVSFETIRRDLEHLEREGFLKRVHGGAVLETINSVEQSFITRETHRIEEKQAIAELATNFVVEGQSIAMDVSTTNTEIARALKKKFTQLTVITNSLQIATELSEKQNYTIILAGGVLRNQELCVVGNMAEEFISRFNIDVFFMSASGISLSSGITDYGIGEVNIKKRMLKNAQKTFVVADSSKFNNVSLLEVCDLYRVDAILTSPSLNEQIKDKFQGANVKIIMDKCNGKKGTPKA